MSTIALFDAPLAPTVLSHENLSETLSGELTPVQIDVGGSSSNTDTLVKMVRACEVEDAAVILSKYMCVPLLFAQKEANRSQSEHDKNVYVMRQARTHVSKIRAKKARAKKSDGWIHASSKSSQASRSSKADCGLQNRGYVQCAAPHFFSNSCNDKEGMVLRSPTGINAGQVGFMTNVVTQGIQNDGTNAVCAIDGVSFSNEPPCKCCGIVPTNMATCLLAARRGSSSLECLQNSLADFIEVLTAHEERFREEHGIGPMAWSNCAACCGGGEECAYYFGSACEAGDALSKCLAALQAKHGEDNLIKVFDNVAQHRFRDCIDMQIDADHAESAADEQRRQGWNVSTMLEQIGALAEVIPGRPVVSREDEARGKAMYKARIEAEMGPGMSESPLQKMAMDNPTPPPPLPKDQKRMKLLEPVRLEYYNADCTMQTTYHDVGDIVEFPTDATTPGTRMVILEDVVGKGAPTDVNLRRRTVAEIGDIVRVSFHHRSSAVDEHRLSKEKLAYLREIGVLESAEKVPQLIANMVVTTDVSQYKEWQRKALASYSKLELLDVVTEPLAPCVRAARERLHKETAPVEYELLKHMTCTNARGSPRTAALPLVELRNVRRDLHRSYYNSVESSRDLIRQDQSQQLYAIDRWIQDYRDRYKGDGDSIPEQQILHHIYQLLTLRYIHGAGKYSDLDQYVIPLKLRMGISTGLSQNGRFRTSKERKEWRSLEIRGDDVVDDAERKLSQFVRSKYERLKRSGPWR